METRCLKTETLSVYALVTGLCTAGLLAVVVAAGTLGILGMYHGAFFRDPTFPACLITYAVVQFCCFASTLIVIRAFLLGKIFSYRVHFGFLAIVALLNTLAALFLLSIAGVLDLPAIGEALRKAVYEFMQHVYNACCVTEGFGQNIPDCSDTILPTEPCIENQFELGGWVSSSTCELVASFDAGLIGNSSGSLQACGGGDPLQFVTQATEALNAATLLAAILVSVLAGITAIVLFMSIFIHCCAKVDEAVEKRAKKKRTFRALSQLRMDQELGRRASANVAAKLPPPPGLLPPAHVRHRPPRELEVQSPPPFQAPIAPSANSSGPTQSRASVRPERLGSGVTSSPVSQRTGSLHWKPPKPERFRPRIAPPLPPRDTSSKTTSLHAKTPSVGLDATITPSHNRGDLGVQRKVESRNSGAVTQSSSQGADVHSPTTGQTYRKPVWFLEEDDY